MRSKWKPNFSIIKIASIGKINNTSARITEAFFDKRTHIYNGRDFFSIIIRNYIFGHAFGQYFRTKKFGDFHPLSVKKRKGKKPKIKNKKAKKNYTFSFSVKRKRSNNKRNKRAKKKYNEQ